MESAPHSSELDQSSKLLSIGGLFRLFRNLRERATNISVAIDPGAQAEHEYVFPFAEYHGRADPILEIVQEQLRPRAED
jgi:hypothetical protein